MHHVDITLYVQRSGQVTWTIPGDYATTHHANDVGTASRAALAQCQTTWPINLADVTLRIRGVL